MTGSNIGETPIKPILYYAPNTCALASHIALEETGAEVDYVRLDLAKGDTQSPAYLKLNPKGRVPVIKTDRGVLSETPAILAWIAQTWPQANLVPRNDWWGVAQVNSFNNFLSGTLHGIAYAGIFRSPRYADGEQAQASVRAKAFQTLTETFAMIESKLSPGAWVHGGDYTTSDTYLTVLYGWRKALDRELPAYPKLAMLAERALARPAAQRAIEKETTAGLHAFQAA